MLVRAFYCSKSKANKTTAMSHAHECVFWGQAQASKNLMNFCKTSKRENRKVRKVAKSRRKPRITKAVLLQAFFPPAKTLKCRRVSNYSPIPKLSRIFFPEFLSKVPIQGTARPTPPSLSLVKSSLASSWLMRNRAGEVT